MSKTRREQDYLLDIEDAIRRILEYTAGMNWDDYEKVIHEISKDDPGLG